MFEVLGIDEKFFPKYKHDFSGKTLLIAASGRCVWDDLAKWHEEGTDYMCVNDVVMHFPYRVRHAYSNDDKWLPKWCAARRPMLQEQNGPMDMHTCAPRGGSTMTVWPWPGHGSSSLNAVYTGLAMGYSRIVLAGMPLDDTGHYFDPPWVRTNFVREVPNKASDSQQKLEHPRYWENAARHIFGGKVKSFSGRTKELLGAP